MNMLKIDCAMKLLTLLRNHRPSLYSNVNSNVIMITGKDDGDVDDDDDD